MNLYYVKSSTGLWDKWTENHPRVKEYLHMNDVGGIPKGRLNMGEYLLCIDDTITPLGEGYHRKYTKLFVNESGNVGYADIEYLGKI